jgi:phage baseplate assembly protein W
MSVAYQAPILPHLAVPLVIAPDGSFDIVQQDSVEEVAQSVSVLLGTQLGRRVMVPNYGTPDPTFTEPDAHAIEQTITNWEPRAVPTVTVEIDDSGAANVNVAVALATPGS